MESTLEALRREVFRIGTQLDQLSNALLSEGELTPWAKKQLDKARKTSKDSYTSLEDLEAEISAAWPTLLSSVPRPNVF